MLRSINAADINDDKQYIATHPVFNVSEHNLSQIDQLVEWGPNIAGDPERKDIIQNSNGLIFISGCCKLKAPLIESVD